eukprot:8743841-Pyramimonas_sp.AAC.1
MAMRSEVSQSHVVPNFARAQNQPRHSMLGSGPTSRWQLSSWGIILLVILAYCTVNPRSHISQILPPSGILALL